MTLTHCIVGTARRQPLKYRTTCRRTVARDCGNYVYTVDHVSRITCSDCKTALLAAFREHTLLDKGE